MKKAISLTFYVLFLFLGEVHASKNQNGLNQKEEIDSSSKRHQIIPYKPVGQQFLPPVKTFNPVKKTIVKTEVNPKVVTKTAPNKQVEQFLPPVRTFNPVKKTIVKTETNPKIVTKTALNKQVGLSIKTFNPVKKAIIKTQLNIENNQETELFPNEIIPSVQEQIDLYRKVYTSYNNVDFDPQNTHISEFIDLLKIGHSYIAKGLPINDTKRHELLQTFWKEIMELQNGKKMTISVFKKINMRWAFLLGEGKEKSPFYFELFPYMSEIDKSPNKWKLLTYDKGDFAQTHPYPFCFEAILYHPKGELEFKNFIDTYLNPGFPIGISALPYIGKGPHGDNIEDPASFLDHDISGHWKKIFVENIISLGGAKHWPAFRGMLSKIYENDKSPFTMAGLFLIPHEIFTSIYPIMNFEKNEYSEINEFIKKDTTEQLEDCERLQFKKLLVSTFLERQSLSPMSLMMEQAFGKIKSSKYPNLYFEPHKLEIDKNTNNFSVEILPMISTPSKLSTDLVSSPEQESYDYYNSFGGFFKINGMIIPTKNLNREKVKIEKVNFEEIISREYLEEQKNQLQEISKILKTKYDMESLRQETISIFSNQTQEVFSKKLWFNIINVDIFNTINSVLKTNLSFNSSEKEIEKVLLSFIMQFYNKHKGLFSTKKMN